MLGSKEILKLITEKKMVTDYINLKRQLQPNGFDLTVGMIFKIFGRGCLEEGRKSLLSHSGVITHDVGRRKYWSLHKGPYLIRFNETIKLPRNVSAITIQRSSLIRMLCHTHVGSWDAGYNGRGTTMLIVNNPEGIEIEHNVRIVQMHFFKTTKVLKQYDGSYQKENLVVHRRTKL